MAATDDFHQLYTWYIRECALATITVNLVAICQYQHYKTDDESNNEVKEPSKTGSWRRSWRPAPKQASKDVAEITSGSALWRDVAPVNTPSQEASRLGSRDANDLVTEKADMRAESPVDRPHMGTFSSLSTSSWLNIDGD